MPNYNKDSLNSVGDSWATISISEESGNLIVDPSQIDLLQPPENDNDCDETNLDETLPVDALDEMETVDIPQTKYDYLWPTPIPPKEIREFRPVHCSSSIHPESEIAIKKSQSFEFKPKFCSSKLENNGTPLLQRQLSHANPHDSHVKSPAPTKCDYLWPTPIPPKDIREFRPVHCSSSIHPESEIAIKKSQSFDFKPKFCSSKLENNGTPLLQRQLSHANPQDIYFKSPAPIIREIAKLKPCLRSISVLRPNHSEEFNPQRCSTALSESELKLNKCPTDLVENSNMFVPLRCSTGNSECSSPGKAFIPAEFTPFRTSTGLHENSAAFMPLRCSTGLNESTTFNPPMSSTAQHKEDTNIPEFKNLRLRSASNLL